MSNDEQQTGVGDSQNEMVRGSSPAAARQGNETHSLVFYLFTAGVIAIFVRIFIAAPYLVSGPSMEATFHNHDYLIIDRFSYGICAPSIGPLKMGSGCIPVGDPKRGDVIVFKLPKKGETLIKRIIGLPGETITIEGSEVRILNTEHPEGFTLAEQYISPQDTGGPTGVTVTIPADYYFVMGDNRRVSYDSRSWGLLPREAIVGRVLLRLYPFPQIEFLPGGARYQ